MLFFPLLSHRFTHTQHNTHLLLGYQWQMAKERKEYYGQQAGQQRKLRRTRNHFENAKLTFQC